MIPPVDIAYIAGELRRLSDELKAAHEDQNGDADTDPGILLAHLHEILDGLRRLDWDQERGSPMSGEGSAGGTDIHTLANHGIALLSRLSALAGRLRRPAEARAIEDLALPLACWIARRGGEISDISGAVNTAAALANNLKQPAELEELYILLSELVNAVNPRVSQDTVARLDSNRPWRILLLNRAIVATRSHRPALMKDAFESLIEHLPEEASDFFREGMEQMDALGYPPQVRQVMERYYEKWCGRRVLH